MTKTSPAAEARIALGLSIEKAAKKARICPAYLRQVELNGSQSYQLARRLSSIYQCRLDLFLPSRPVAKKPATKKKA